MNLRGYDPGKPVTPGEALERFLRALDVPASSIPADVEARAALYRSRLAGRRMLIVLDNASTVGQVRPLLPGTQGCLVLVTSRSRLSGLVARDGARRLTLTTLPEPDAVALIRRVAGDYRWRLALALDNLAGALSESGATSKARAHWAEVAGLLAEFTDPVAARLRERISRLSRTGQPES